MLRKCLVFQGEQQLIMEVAMSRWTILTVVVMLFWFTMIGCSGGGSDPLLPSSDPGTGLTLDNRPTQSTNTFLMGYYDVIFSFDTRTFEVLENRTAQWTLNIVPFMNQIAIPQYGVQFANIVIYEDDPEVWGVDVDFKLFHPMPGLPQYDIYDVLGVLICDSSGSIEYNDLDIPIERDDTFVKNPDGYTRWFNPTEFTEENIVGYFTGGYQNYAGNATLNPYKYYSMGLGVDDDAFDFLASANNHDGIFTTGLGRKMELVFPLLPEPWVKFGYAVVVAWEDLGSTGPYHPYYMTEPVACKAEIIPNLYWDGDQSGGELVADVSLLAWDVQPSVVKIESSVLDDIAEIPADMYAQAGGENYSTYHVEIQADPFNGTENHEFWVIAEYPDFGYTNGFTFPAPEDCLAGFFHFELPVLGGPGEPSIEVKSPNGGETLIVGKPANIIWQSLNITGNVVISYSAFGEGGPWFQIFSETEDDGIQEWIPQSSNVSNAGRIRVTSIDFPIEADDISDGDIIIGEQHIQVTAPNGYNYWTVGQPYNITWDYAYIYENVRIVLSIDGGATYPLVIAASTPCDGVFFWEPESQHVSKTCRVKITALENPDLFDESDNNFTIRPNLKNVDVSYTGGLGKDISMDDSNGDVLVLYADGRVRRYTASSYYTSYTTDITTNGNAGTGYIDLAKDGNWFVCYDINDDIFSMHYNASDAWVRTNAYDYGITNLKNVFDATTVHSGWCADDHIVNWGYDTALNFIAVATKYEDNGFLSYTDRYYQCDIFGGLTGENILNYKWVVGSECDPDAAYMWFVEDDDYRASCWDIFDMTYTGISFGTGSPTTADTGLYSPLDITVGKLNHMYVLDQTGSIYSNRLKAFDPQTGNPIVPSLYIPYYWPYYALPRRMDGSMTQQMLALLRTSSSATYLSIYYDYELP